MAKIGLRNFMYSVIESFNEDGTPKYTGAKSPGKAVSAKVSTKTNTAELYADDGLAESDYSFASGTIELEVDRDDPDTEAELLGHSVTHMDAEGEVCEKASAVTTVIDRNTNDAAPYVGVARIVRKMVDGAVVYRAEILYKVKFSEPSQDEKTTGESMSFDTSTLSGTIAALDTGAWSTAYESADRATVVKMIGTTFSADGSGRH